MKRAYDTYTYLYLTLVVLCESKRDDCIPVGERSRKHSRRGRRRASMRGARLQLPPHPSRDIPPDRFC